MEIRQRGAHRMEGVGGCDPARPIIGELKPVQKIAAAFVVGKIDASLVDSVQRDRNDRGEDVAAKLLPDALLQHFARKTLLDTVGHDILKNAGDDRVIIAIIPREDNRDIRRMRSVRLPCALVDLAIIVLRREGERMMDPI